ncbi:MAG: hypothetical protein LBH32_00950 [Dysgonamonadaceae bacterium]|jgi:hypothetical protein|nr:hypothetical protein [Dysgonamonadaceae bacterium]
MRDKALNIELMSLKFFSSRFLIRKPYLEYGIVQKTWKVRKGMSVVESGEIEWIPAILIKDTRLYIDVCDDRLYPLVSDSYYGFKAFPCEFLQDETDYIFRASEHELKLNKRAVASFYSSKCFSLLSGRVAGTERFLTDTPPAERVPNDD